MRWFALVPGLLLGIVMAMVTGMWQFALFTFVSVFSAALTTALIRRKRREPDVDYSDQPLWVSSQGLAVGDRVLSRSGWFFKEQFSDLFFDHFSKLAAEREVQKRTQELEATFYRSSQLGVLPFWAGVSESNSLEFDLARDGPHALIVGATGAGKSEFLKLITGSMLSSTKPASLQLVLVDFKGGAALRGLSRHPAALTLLTDLDEGRHERFWLYLGGELKRREKLLAGRGISSIDEFPELERMLVLADELPAIITSTQLALPILESIAARGRSLGVHLIATSQSLSGIPRSLITNLTMRFALGAIDPGDLISLMPSMRASTATARAKAIWGNNSASFDYPIPKLTPSQNESPYFPELIETWSKGLPELIPSSKDLLAVLDIPSQQRFELLEFTKLSPSSILVVGTSQSGKSTFCTLARNACHSAVVLDTPSIAELEEAFLNGRQVICAMSSNFLLPLSIQRRFEHVIYLRQGNQDQHMAAGLPKGQWSDKLVPGRGWFRNQPLQLAMPARSQESQIQVHEPEQLVH